MERGGVETRRDETRRVVPGCPTMHGCIHSRPFVGLANHHLRNGSPPSRRPERKGVEQVGS